MSDEIVVPGPGGIAPLVVSQHEPTGMIRVSQNWVDYGGRQCVWAYPAQARALARALDAMAGPDPEEEETT